MQKRLYRIDEGKMICGVCGGLAEYFNIDPTIVRLACVLLGCSGTGIIFYIAAAIIMPEKPKMIES
jgi:phage shock protein PspC (stress-responsive transcriptional regulator)